jgi:alpha-galactosidase
MTEGNPNKKSPVAWDAANWRARDIDDPATLPKGDMPGDRIFINEAVEKKAISIFPALMDRLAPLLESSNRAVVSIYGGSGSGKSVLASLIAYHLRGVRVGAYILSGDNYPHRIPRDNDRERVWAFREYGLKGLVAAGEYTQERLEVLRALQDRNEDSDADLCQINPWLAAYQAAGRAALTRYLGTPQEIDFAEISAVIERFKSGAPILQLKRMGRDDRSIWYDQIDVSDVSALVLEWTHGNSDWLTGVDLPVFLDSTPGETMEHRRDRARDAECDSPFTGMVLDIEQRALIAQAPKAALIVARNGKILSLDEYRAESGRNGGA